VRLLLLRGDVDGHASRRGLGRAPHAAGRHRPEGHRGGNRAFRHGRRPFGPRQRHRLPRHQSACDAACSRAESASDTGGLALASVLGLTLASTASAQQAPTITAGDAAQTSIVRTTSDHVSVWRRSPSQIVAVLPRDIDLEAVAKEGQWYLVRLPDKYALPG